jgi:hydroxymethylpyrimidine/phosphomethylpyrimidine kinase
MTPDSSSPPVALTIAGSDNSAGAGAQADLKTFTAHRVYGLTALTCVVAEVPGRVSSIQPVRLDVLREQIELSLASYPVAAIKTGLLHSREVIELVAGIYGGLPGRTS